MPVRHVSLLLLILSIPAMSQHTTLQARINQTVNQHQEEISQVSASPEPSLRAARLTALQHDANELSSLTTSVQSDLQKLQHGMLVKDLNENLKKMEKLSKKVRREIE